jgi:hypothetical protein
MRMSKRVKDLLLTQRNSLTRQTHTPQHTAECGGPTLGLHKAREVTAADYVGARKS